MNKDELALVISIESGCVRGSLVLFSHASAPAIARQTILPRVFHTTSSEIVSRPGTSSGVKLLSAMLNAIAVVSGNLVEEGLKITAAHSVNIPISKIHVVFSSPWVISKTKTVKISYEKETSIAVSTIDTILNEERHELERQFAAEHDASLEFDLAFIEQKIFEIKLNGYPVVHFENKKVRKLEVSFAISISSKNILDRIEKVLEKSVQTTQRAIACHSSLLLQYSALRAIVSNESDYTVVHVHNEISDIIVVKNGVCAAMASFPSGTTVFSQTSAAMLKQSKEVTHSSLNLQSKNALHPLESRRIKAIADSSGEIWAGQLMKTFASLDLDREHAMPHRVYLLTNDHYSHFERALKSQSLNVIPIEKSVVDSAVSHEHKERENALMSLYVFALRHQ